jgi:catechol 2,3-dioxygenase-like lactoylglutathione lyase family enzyme
MTVPTALTDPDRVSGPHAIQDVIVVSVPVSDQARAKEFHVEKLGFELLGEDDSVPGLHCVRLAPKGGGTSLTLVTWFESMPAGSLQGLVLRSSDLQADYEDLVARGVRFDGPPQPQPWASLKTVARDPDGNGLVLQQA